MIVVQWPPFVEVQLVHQINFSYMSFLTVVDDQMFHVHRSTISMWSPVFETTFASEFKEKISEIKDLQLII